MTRRLLFLLTAAISGAGVAPCAAQVTDPPYSLEMVERMLVGGVHPDLILERVHRACRDFELDRVARGRLTRSGATNEFLQRLGTACVPRASLYQRQPQRTSTAPAIVPRASRIPIRISVGIGAGGFVAPLVYKDEAAVEEGEKPSVVALPDITGAVEVGALGVRARYARLDWNRKGLPDLGTVLSSEVYTTADLSAFYLVAGWAIYEGGKGFYPDEQGPLAGLGVHLGRARRGIDIGMEAVYHAQGIPETSDDDGKIHPVRSAGMQFRIDLRGVF